MATYCGGIKLDKNTLKIINGVICDVGQQALIEVKQYLLAVSSGMEHYLP